MARNVFLSVLRTPEETVMPQKSLFHWGKFFFCTDTSVEVAKPTSRILLQCVIHMDTTPIQNVQYVITINNFQVNPRKKRLGRVKKDLVMIILYHASSPWSLSFFIFGGFGWFFFHLQVFVTILNNTKHYNNVKHYKQCEQCDKLGLITMSACEQYSGFLNNLVYFDVYLERNFRVAKLIQHSF